MNILHEHLKIMPNIWKDMPDWRATLLLNTCVRLQYARQLRAYCRLLGGEGLTKICEYKYYMFLSISCMLCPEICFTTEIRKLLPCFYFYFANKLFFFVSDKSEKILTQRVQPNFCWYPKYSKLCLEQLLWSGYQTQSPSQQPNALTPRYLIEGI